MTARAIAIVLCAISTIASAQETRTGSIAADQVEKATRLVPHEPHWAGKLVGVFGEAGTGSAGFFPHFGSVYRGGSFALGAGYRYFTGDRTQWTVAGLLSAKGYKLIEAVVASPGHLSGYLDFRGSASWLDATQVNYHGLGIDSPADAPAAFGLRRARVDADATARPHKWVVLTAAAAYEGYTPKDPTGSLPPVEAAFTVATAPGRDANPVYLHATTSAAFDWRPAADYARRGGLLRVARHHYADRDSTYSFDRLDAEVVQHVPIRRENWVLSMRGHLQTTLDDEDQVPYFLLPSLGGGSTLRGFNSWRFRDRHAVLLSGEWRWFPNRMALDMALFYDTGMVASSIDAIALTSFASDVGVGMRFHTRAQTPLRIELAKGSEGLRIVFASGAAF